jgi:hypothetical protein
MLKYGNIRKFKPIFVYICILLCILCKCSTHLI